ncbi:MAG: hypothetical protein EHM70_00775 [Chloroflexota bacterium]|nr:MAG: hypothetical protein EHM70_00775 [Chloroflexota bacterium]
MTMKIPIQPTDAVISEKYLRYKIIPDLPQHDVIYSVAAGADGKIYMGVCSEFGGAVHAHFASYDPKTDQYRDIIHLEDLLPEGKDRFRPPHAKIHTAMAAHPDGRIIWVSHMTPPIEGEKIHRIYEIYGDPERGYVGSCVFCYNPKTDQVENLGRIYPFAGTRSMTLNPERDEIYTVSYPTAHFAVFRLRSGESKDLGRIAQNDAIGPCWSANGCAYTTDDDGYIIRYDPEKEQLDRLPVRIPFPAWHFGHRNRVRRVKIGSDGIKIYGLTGLSCRLFEYDPGKGSHGTMRDVGLLMGEEKFETANRIPQGKSLAFNLDGTATIGLNVGGGEFPQVHLMQVDPKSGEGVDHGRMEIPGMLPIHTVQDACMGQDGTIYLGGAMGTPPTFLAAFNPNGLAESIVCDQEAEIEPYRLASQELQRKDQELRRKFDEHRVYWIMRATPFVNHGTVLMHDLGLPGFLPLIPDGESAITALALGSSDRLYGATSGTASHLFVQWTSTRSVRPFDFPIDLGIFTVDGKTQTGCRALVSGPDGCLYAGTLNADGSSGHLFRHDPAREIPGQIEEFSFYSPPFDHSYGLQLEDFGAPAEGEGILALVSDAARGILYGLGSKGTLFSYRPGSGELCSLAKVEGPGYSNSLICDRDGNVYGSMGEARLFRYQADKETLECLPVSLPCGQGRGYLNAISAFVWGTNGCAYCGTTVDGMLFSLEIDPESSQVKVVGLGKPTWSGYIRALTAGKDGKIYGIAGRPDVFSRLFVYDPTDGDLRDLGILETSIPRPWVGQRFDSVTTGANGEIFLGEADRISHLFVYYPPICSPNR